MARTLKPAERRDLAEKAYGLALKRLRYVEIGRRLGISRQLASTLVREERARRGDERRNKEEVEMLVAERDKAIGALNEVIRHAWQQFRREDLDPNSTYLPGYLNTIVKAQAQIERILGLRHMSLEGEGEELRELERAVRELRKGD